MERSNFIAIFLFGSYLVFIATIRKQSQNQLKKVSSTEGLLISQSRSEPVPPKIQKSSYVSFEPFTSVLENPPIEDYRVNSFKILFPVFL